MNYSFFKNVIILHLTNKTVDPLTKKRDLVLDSSSFI